MKSKEQKQTEALDRISARIEYLRRVAKGEEPMTATRFSLRDFQQVEGHMMWGLIKETKPHVTLDVAIPKMAERKIKALERDSTNLKRKLGTLWPKE